MYDLYIKYIYRTRNVPLATAQHSKGVFRGGVCILKSVCRYSVSTVSL